MSQQSHNVESSVWPGLSDLKVVRQWPLVMAILGFFAYMAGVIGGSVLQSVAKLPLSMGWGQQLFGALAVLIFAWFHREPKRLLGLPAPTGPWLRTSVLIGLVIAVVGTVVGMLIGVPPTPHDAEYFAYQAIAPGIGEELGFRGLVLGFLVTFAHQRGWARGGGWPMLIAAALPFGALHILEHSGVQLIALMLFTTFAGALLGWSRMATASLLPAIVAHNIANVTSGVIDMLLLQIS